MREHCLVVLIYFRGLYLVYLVLKDVMCWADVCMSGFVLPLLFSGSAGLRSIPFLACMFPRRIRGKLFRFRLLPHATFFPTANTSSWQQRISFPSSLISKFSWKFLSPLSIPHWQLLQSIPHHQIHHPPTTQRRLYSIANLTLPTLLYLEGQVPPATPSWLWVKSVQNFGLSKDQDLHV